MRIDVRTILLSLLLCLLIIICCVSSNQDMLLNWLGIYIYIYGMATWHWEKKEELFSLYSIFWSFLFVFSFGQCVMWAFHIGLDEGIGSEILYYGTGFIPSKADLIDAKWYTCISMICFHFGALALSGKARDHLSSQEHIEAVDSDSSRRALFISGAIITAIIAPIVIFLKGLEAIIASRYGYAALYYGEYSTQGGYIQIISFLFYPGLIALLIGSKLSKETTRNVLIIFCVYAFLGLLSGDRDNWLYSLILLIWLLRKRPYHKKRNPLKLIVAGIVGIYLLSVITVARNSGGVGSLSLRDFTEAFKLENSPIVDAFFEMGWTMGIITFFLMKGSGIFPYSNTYITAILGAVSSDFLSRIGIEQVLIGDWFSQDYLSLDYGTGFSMIGEAYVNGGYVGGFIYMIILGVIIGPILRTCQTNAEIENAPIKAFIAISFANIIMAFPRGAAYLLIKEFVYGIGPILLIYFIIKRILYRKNAK